MTKLDLERRLDEALQSFSSEISVFNDYSKAPVSEGQLKDSMKQVFYALNSFKQAILEYVN